jgi:hypothetical protein
VRYKTDTLGRFYLRPLEGIDFDKAFSEFKT